MPTATYDLIGSVTIGTAIASLEFANVSSDYRDLIAVIQPASSSLATIELRLNNSTPAQLVWLEGYGTTDIENMQTTNLGRLADETYVTGNFGFMGIVYVFDANQSDKFSPVVTRAGRARDSQGYNGTSMTGMRGPYAAVTNVKFIYGGGQNFEIGSKGWLYGVKA